MACLFCCMPLAQTWHARTEFYGLHSRFITVSLQCSSTSRQGRPLTGGLNVSFGFAQGHELGLRLSSAECLEWHRKSGPVLSILRSSSATEDGRSSKATEGGHTRNADLTIIQHGSGAPIYGVCHCITYIGHETKKDISVLK